MKKLVPIPTAGSPLSLAVSLALVGLTSLAAFAQEPQAPQKDASAATPGVVAVAGQSDSIEVHPDALRRLKVGERIPNFVLTGLDGALIQRSDYQGRTLVLVYLSAGQRNSERAAADAARVLKKYADEPMDLLLVTADVGHEQYFQTLLEEAHITTPLGFDVDHNLYSKLGLIAFPSTLVVRGDGTLDHVILTRRSDYPHLLDAFVSHALGIITSHTLEQRLVAPTMSRSSAKTKAQRHREAARLLRDNELFKGAEKELKRAVELDSDSLSIRIDLADLYIHMKRYAEAEVLLDQVFALDADHRGARLLLGISRFQTGKLEQAEEILKEALVMNPDPERTHYYLGRIYEARGEWESAIFHYRNALDRMLPQ